MYKQFSEREIKARANEIMRNVLVQKAMGESDQHLILRFVAELAYNNGELPTVENFFTNVMLHYFGTFEEHEGKKSYLDFIDKPKTSPYSKEVLDRSYQIITDLGKIFNPWFEENNESTEKDIVEKVAHMVDTLQEAHPEEKLPDADIFIEGCKVFAQDDGASQDQIDDPVNYWIMQS